MKSFVVAVVIYSLALSCEAGLSLPPELTEIVDEAHRVCKDRSGVDEEILKNAMVGKFTDDPKLKCFLKCMFQELQAMKDDGTFDLDLIEASLPPEYKDRGAIESLRKCLPSSGKELCQAAYDTLICMHKVNPRLAELFD